MALPLKGLKVIDLTKDFAGPFCTMILSDLGAEVIKIEKPGTGDETRSWGPPFVKGVSYYFQSLNRGKKSVALDLHSKKGQDIVRELVKDADILVESFQPGKMEAFNLDYVKLRRINKALVYCSISGFGQTGPYRDRLGYDLVAFAMSGIMATTGTKDGPPIRVSVPVADIAAGHYASTAILACLARRLVSGRGEYIDISLYESITSWLTYLAPYYQATGEEPLKMGSAHPSIVPYQAFKCKNGYIVIAVGNDEQWNSFCQAIQTQDFMKDKRFMTNPARVKNRDVLVPLISKKLRKRTVQYWQSIFEKNNVPSGPIYTISKVLKDRHLQDRKFIQKDKSTIVLGSPMRIATSHPISRRRIPSLGEDTQRILRLE